MQCLERGLLTKRFKFTSPLNADCYGRCMVNRNNCVQYGEHQSIVVDELQNCCPSICVSYSNKSNLPGQKLIRIRALLPDQGIFDGSNFRGAFIRIQFFGKKNIFNGSGSGYLKARMPDQFFFSMGRIRVFF